MNHVGDLMILKMREQNTFTVLSRDGLMGEVGRELGLKLYSRMNQHPVSYMNVTADWLSRDGRFTKSTIRAHDLRGRSCLLRCFRLMERFR